MFSTTLKSAAAVLLSLAFLSNADAHPIAYVVVLGSVAAFAAYRVRKALALRVIYGAKPGAELTRKLRVVFVVQTPAMRDPKTLLRDVATGATLAYWGAVEMPEVGTEFTAKFKVKGQERYKGKPQTMIYAPKAA